MSDKLYKHNDSPPPHPLATATQDPVGYRISEDQGKLKMILLDGLGQPSAEFTPPGCETTAVWVNVGRERVAAVYVRRPDAKYTVLLSHGNAEDIGLMAGFIRSLSAQLNCSVFAYDYPGYGASSGSASESQLYSAIEAVWCELRQRFGVPAKRIILYGVSIGSAPTVHLAAKFGRRFGIGSLHTPAGVVLHAPLCSGLRVLRPKTSVTLCCDPFANISRIEGITVPTLIIHGTDDEIISVDHSYKLVAKCPEAVTPLFIETATHNDLDTFAPFYPRLKAFLIELDRSMSPS